MTMLHNVYAHSLTDSWNAILGLAKGAYNPDWVKGSSSGSAIALALG